MGRDVRYCTADDGVRIAYCVEGEGPPLLISPFFIESFALEELVPEHQHFMAELGKGRTLIRYDGRGVGLGQRHGADLSQEVVTRDIRAVVSALGLRRYSMWASTTNGPSALVHAARYPEEVSALILYATYPNIREGYPTFSPDVIGGFADLARNNWFMASQVFADMTGRKDFPEATARIAEWYRQSADGAEVGDLIAGSNEIDAAPLLGKITARTLVLHRLNDPTYPLELGPRLASAIPGARFVPLPGQGHAFFLGESEIILDTVKTFLDEDPETRAITAKPEAAPVDSSFRTVLFTDLVGHTEMMSRLGDERGRAVLREHEDITRNVLKQYGGTEVKTMGDGFMASFGSVTKSVECAIALQRAFAGREGEPLSVRVGLNAGEPIEEDGDLFGATVILASRIAAKAEGGEILVADTVRGLCSGKGFLFADRGEFVAKGFEEPVRVYQVSWRG
jgi:class 3 adenylate cyclase/pimeloyl-ACP methyl ester carboxylesterase